MGPVVVPPPSSEHHSNERPPSQLNVEFAPPADAPSDTPGTTAAARSRTRPPHGRGVAGATGRPAARTAAGARKTSGPGAPGTPATDPTTPAPPLVLPEIDHYELDGVPLFHLPGTGSTTLALEFRVGMADEPVQLRGISHLAEHLLMSAVAARYEVSNGTTGPLVVSSSRRST